jgi:membrane fusion protein, macrolide-specific efflux system
LLSLAIILSAGVVLAQVLRQPPIVLFEVSNADLELMSGMSTQVQFEVAQAQNALLFPARALGAPAADGSYRATVLDEQRRLSTRTLNIGLRNAGEVQILSGLAEGDQVLAGPVPALQGAAAAAAAASADSRAR